jgi:hypothetical protein
VRLVNLENCHANAPLTPRPRTLPDLDIRGRSTVISRSAKNEARKLCKMETATKMHIRARESVIRTIRGQSVTEYSLIFASIAWPMESTRRWAMTSSRSPAASVLLWPMRAVAFCTIDESWPRSRPAGPF